mmetsp:Transcript_9030/g.18687  ORF Transcript_9030/g.18687 Transcript_9030/m.18687 type:complete len:155 (+) Transcript_9030:1-465(+)
MEWHPVFQEFPVAGAQSVRPVREGFGQSSGKNSYLSQQRTGSYDFRTWGASRSLKELRGGKPSGQYWRRTIAPGVVEREPRARSISNFPGYDPSRDRNFFDRNRPWSVSSHASTPPSPFVTRAGGMEVQTLKLDPLPTPPRTGSSRRSTSSSRP